MFVVSAGIHDSQRPAINSAGREFFATLDHVELTAFGQTAPLSRAVTIREMVAALETSLAPQVESLDTGGSDIVVAVMMEMPDGESPHTQELVGSRRKDDASP